MLQKMHQLLEFHLLQLCGPTYEEGYTRVDVEDLPNKKRCDLGALLAAIGHQMGHILGLKHTANPSLGESASPSEPPCSARYVSHTRRIKSRDNSCNMRRWETSRKCGREHACAFAGPPVTIHDAKHPAHSPATLCTHRPTRRISPASANNSSTEKQIG